MIVRQNYICTGGVDKKRVRKFGLIILPLLNYTESKLPESCYRCCLDYSLLFLQQHGFTCGMDDLVLVAESEELRVKELAKAGAAAKPAAEAFVQVKDVPEMALRSAVSARVTPNVQIPKPRSMLALLERSIKSRRLLSKFASLVARRNPFTEIACP